MVSWYWSADTFFWKVSIDQKMVVQYWRSMPRLQKSRLHVSANLLHVAGMWPPCCQWQPMHPPVILLVMITTRKSICGFPFLSYMSMVLCLVALLGLACVTGIQRRGRGENEKNEVRSSPSITRCTSSSPLNTCQAGYQEYEMDNMIKIALLQFYLLVIAKL